MRVTNKIHGGGGGVEGGGGGELVDIGYDRLTFHAGESSNTTVLAA